MHPNQNAAAQQLQQVVQNFVGNNPQAAQLPVGQLVAAVQGQGAGGGGGGPHWDPTKCPNGFPPNFGPNEAAQALQNADFTQSVYVNTSARTGTTRQAYTYVQVGNLTITVVGHIHIDRGGGNPRPGRSYIPGFEGWMMRTPAPQVAVIAALPDGGVFPDGNRYPH